MTQRARRPIVYVGRVHVRFKRTLLGDCSVTMIIDARERARRVHCEVTLQGIVCLMGLLG
jgi:hypothetical protein